MRPALRLALLFAALLALAPASAAAQFGFEAAPTGLEVSATTSAGAPVTAVGSHPNELRIDVGLQNDGVLSDGDLRDLRLSLPPGLLLNPMGTATCAAGLCGPADAEHAVCSAAEFDAPRTSPFHQSLSGEDCPGDTQVGTLTLASARNGGETRTFGLFNLAAPYGAPLALGASPYGLPIIFTARVREADAGLDLELRDFTQGLDVSALAITLWGVPWDETHQVPFQYTHEGLRGDCLNEGNPADPYGVPTAFTADSVKLGSCAIGPPGFLAAFAKSYVTLPPAPCAEALGVDAIATSWQGDADTRAVQINDGTPLSGCLDSLTSPSVRLTTDRASYPAGMLFTVDASAGGGLYTPQGVSLPQIKRAELTLPEGLTLNPALASGLKGCSAAQFAAEQLETKPGEGCPDASKVGTVTVEEMLGVPEPVQGALYLATPYENPLGARIALYILTRSPKRGLLVRAIGKLEPDPASGRLRATFDDLPRLAYSRFTLSLREGLRSVFVSPPACGSYASEVEMHSWAQGTPHPLSNGSSAFAIAHDAAGGPCPAGALPFAPTLSAGAANPIAAASSPFYLQIDRGDAEQEITSYSATFPRGLLASLVGVGRCPDTAIAAARARSADAELADPSCPVSSRIGHTLAGYGAGGILAYATGGLYLAGPYNGAPLSILAIDSARIGPFDLGNVVVRAAVRIDPRTAQARIDPTGSDPIPHILAGIPLHVREIGVHVDRPDFVRNPTNCSPTSVLSTLGGAGTDPFDPSDNTLATATTPFGLLDCQALGFEPRLRLKLLGSRRRGGHPALRAVLSERPADANIAAATVTLPPSQFLAQKHIRGICQARQFERDACPPDSIYGHARAFTPLLDSPLEGPVYLRSSPNPLPDMVAALRGAGGIEIEVGGRISSVRGALRASFDTLPDAPVSRFVMTLQGGKRGLLENSESLCKGPAYATALFTGHNNAVSGGKVKLANQCKRKAKRVPRAKGARQ